MTLVKSSISFAIAIPVQRKSIYLFQNLLLKKITLIIKQPCNIASKSHAYATHFFFFSKPMAN